MLEKMKEMIADQLDVEAEDITLETRFKKIWTQILLIFLSW